jgi:twitching motility protein PilT
VPEGWRGRVAALEVLLTNGAISSLIREGKTFQIASMMQVGRAQGMVSLNDALAELVRKGLLTPEEAILRAVDKPGLETLLKRR